MRLRIGTRGSELALVQARAIGRALEAAGAAIEIVVVRTAGDADRTRPFAQIGPPGVFVRELETALIERDVDVVVHCYKDLPSESPAELRVAAVPEREAPGDVLLVREDAFDADGGAMPLGTWSRVGTSAARRRALLLDERPDLQALALRGNVPTRIQKLLAGDYEAIVLAEAGLVRLAAAAERGECDAPPLDSVVRVPLDPTVHVPAPSQGALALQVRAADDAALVEALEHAPTRRAVAVERALLTRAQAGCDAPFGAWCRPAGDALALDAVFEIDGHLARARATDDDPIRLAGAVWRALTGGAT